MKEEKVLLEIVKCFLEEKEFVPQEEIDEKRLYHLAKKHKMSNFLMDWAREHCQDAEIRQKIENDYSNQIVKDTNENLEFEAILHAFEEAGIQTLVFKGFLMKAVYPQSYMRQMCDIDLLVAPKDFKRAIKILENLGYKKHYDREHHLVFTKDPFMIIELHRKLIFGEEIGWEYFNHQIWDLAVPYQNYHHIYQMTKEDAYLFCITHLIRHFKFAGIAIRDVLDVYLYYEKYKNRMNRTKIDEKLIDFGIKDFEENMRKIAYKWFGSVPNYQFDQIDEFIFKGTNPRVVQVYFDIGNKGGKISYLKQMIFPSFHLMKAKYPILEKMPILLPFVWTARLFIPIRTSFSRKIGKNKIDP